MTTSASAYWTHIKTTPNQHFGLGFRVQVVGFRAQGLGFRVAGFGFGIQGSGCRVQVLRFTASRLRITL